MSSSMVIRISVRVTSRQDLHLLVLEESNLAVSGFRDGSTCSMEPMCNIPDSALCKRQNITIKGQVEWEIRYGKISECDPTNVPPVPEGSKRMGFFPGSSIFPRCVLLSAYTPAKI